MSDTPFRKNAQQVASLMREVMPAFPVSVRATDGIVTYNGMSLRDYFAAKAMQGDIAVNGIEGREVEMVAGMAYEMADAMLKARERK